MEEAWRNYFRIGCVIGMSKMCGGGWRVYYHKTLQNGLKGEALFLVGIDAEADTAGSELRSLIEQRKTESRWIDPLTFSLERYLAQARRLWDASDVDSDGNRHAGAMAKFAGEIAVLQGAASYIAGQTFVDIADDGGVAFVSGEDKWDEAAELYRAFFPDYPDLPFSSEGGYRELALTLIQEMGGFPPLV